MASSSTILPFGLVLLIFSFGSISVSQLPSSPPRSPRIIFPIHIDPSTNQFVMRMILRTPLELVIDLGGSITWLSCDIVYTSLSATPVMCTSPQCSLVRSKLAPTYCGLCNHYPVPDNKTIWCHNNACSTYMSNPVTLSVNDGELFSDVINIQTIHSNGQSGNTPDVKNGRYTFGCATRNVNNLLDGLAKYSSGVAGLGRSSVLSLTSQFSLAFRFSRIFALYLATPLYEDDEETYTGAIYFGGGPYDAQFYDYAHQSPAFTHATSSNEYPYPTSAYTPLLFNPKLKEEYFIDLKSINIVHDAYVKKVQLDTKLLSINKETGAGGTKISILSPYTTMETSIFKAFTRAYIEKAKAMNISTVASVAPFGACFGEEEQGKLPSISFVLRNKEMGSIQWVLSSFNTFKHIMKTQSSGNLEEVYCLAFVDGGSSKSMTSVVIGVHQLKERIIEFDISRSRLGFVG